MEPPYDEVRDELKLMLREFKRIRPERPAAS
jgi:hypothetical protein